MKFYILDENHCVKIVPDVITWGTWFESNQRFVQQDTFYDSEDLVTVSTVFLGIDHSFTANKSPATPVLFETMVFGGKHDGDMERYCTWDEAETGHRQMCERVGLIKEAHGKK